MVIFLDMDGVLADFDRGACRVHGVLWDSLLAHRQPGHWNLRPPLSKALGQKTVMSSNQFWAPIHAERDTFWSSLPATDWMAELVNRVQSFRLEWYILTAPSLCATSYYGKALWVKRWFGSEFEGMIPTPHKQLLAKPDTVLIDDRESNVQRFCDAGGHGILFPTQGNRLHHVQHPVEYVESQLKRIV